MMNIQYEYFEKGFNILFQLANKTKSESLELFFCNLKEIINE